MAKSGLDKWFAQKWVDIGSKKKGGGFKKCGRKSASGSKRKYPKCVPAAKANRMTESQRRSAVARKRSRAQGVGGKPTNVKTFAKSAQIDIFTLWIYIQSHLYKKSLNVHQNVSKTTLYMVLTLWTNYNMLEVKSGHQKTCNRILKTC